eukprot:m.84756 g.84756  ORF g.84756 m.84756 type:complete len:1009 (-) comp25800_c0_seq1:252-3278(-)
MGFRVATLMIFSALIASTQATCTTEENTRYSGAALGGPTTATSYGECCDNCIQKEGCSWWTYDGKQTCLLYSSYNGTETVDGDWSGWAGTGPAPSPAPPLNTWSAPHLETSCEKGGKLLKHVGNVPLETCKAACVADTDCFYINHADQSNNDCMLYSTCATPECESGTGWWTTYEYGRSGAQPFAGCVTPPPPPPPDNRDGFDCQVRLLALEYGKRIMDGADVSGLFESLGLDSLPNCSASATVSKQGPPLRSTLPRLSTTDGAIEFYVDGAKGSDSNAGSLMSPFKTLGAAQTHVRATSKTTPITVFVRGGVYYLTETLSFGMTDGGSTSQSAVTWTNYQDEHVVLSGGVDLSGLKWTQSASNPAAMETQVSVSKPIETLFVNGVREIRAKFPNGDPLIPGGAGWNAHATGAAGDLGVSGVQFQDTVSVSSTFDVLLSVGSSLNNQKINFTVNEPQFGFNPTRNNFYAYTNGSADRFNTSLNHPFWNSQVSPGFNTDALTKKWANPATGIVHMYHTGGWGGWMFQIAERPTQSEVVFQCRRLSDNTMVPCPLTADATVVVDGGFQECRGASIGKNQFYVENIEEELDDAREWFWKQSTSKSNSDADSDSDSTTTLMYIPNGTDLNSPNTSVVASVLKQVIAVDGASFITVRGFTITNTAPTYLDSYECPSGGDWAIHRGAAVFVENANSITLEGLSFDQPSGNAVMFSNQVENSVISKCTFEKVGDSAIAMVGSTQLMVGTAGKGLFPTNNTVVGNIVDTVGVYGKQTSAYFKGKSNGNTVRNNIFMNGPRAGVNFNDGTAGGEVLEGNLVFNFVRESGDHGQFNSWDRQPIVRGDATSGYEIVPKTHHLNKNFILNINFLGVTHSGYSVDYDDGSSQYNATNNFLVYGAFKVRDGINRAHSHNLIYGKPADYQCDGFNSTSFEHNTVIDTSIKFGCVGTAFGPLGTYNSVKQNNNNYFTPNNTAMPFSACGNSLKELQTAGYEVGSTISANLTVNQIINMAREMLA